MDAIFLSDLAYCVSDDLFLIEASGKGPADGRLGMCTDRLSRVQSRRDLTGRTGSSTATADGGMREPDRLGVRIQYDR